MIDHLPRSDRTDRWPAAWRSRSPSPPSSGAAAHSGVGSRRLADRCIRGKDLNFVGAPRSFTGCVRRREPLEAHHFGLVTASLVRHASIAGRAVMSIAPAGMLFPVMAVLGTNPGRGGGSDPLVGYGSGTLLFMRASQTMPAPEGPLRSKIGLLAYAALLETWLAPRRSTLPPIGAQIEERDRSFGSIVVQWPLDPIGIARRKSRVRLQLRRVLRDTNQAKLRGSAEPPLRHPERSLGPAGHRDRARFFRIQISPHLGSAPR